jgi:ferredoxin-NADP reductase
MLLPWRTGKVIRIEDATQYTRRFWIQVPELEVFDFKPGQFVTLDLPIHEKKNKRWRSYSIASWPDGSNVFELIIVQLPGGVGTAYLFDEVKVGSELLFRGAQGVFTLPETIEKDLFFICTGTGIAPFRSMVQYIYRNNIPHKNLYLVFGCRMKSDFLYADELLELQEKLPSFNYLPTCSRETGDDPSLRKGYVHAIYEEIINTTKPEANFYLCGWKNMVDEAKQKIIALGYDKKDIHLELYG